MKDLLNPKLKKDDRVVCIFMAGETSVMPGDRGVVKDVGRGPGFTQYFIQWDNGSSLSLIEEDNLPTLDKWMYESDYEMRFKKTKNNLKESNHEEQMNHLMSNIEVFRSFDRNFLFDYLRKVQKSGITNMFGASQYLYMGSERIAHEHKYNEGKDDEAFDEVVEMADEAKNKMVQGAIKILKKQNKEISVNNVASMVKRYATKVLDMWMTTYH
jgi:hypothetical protein